MDAWLVPVYAISNSIAALVCVALIFLCPRNQNELSWRRLRFVLVIAAFWAIVSALSSFSQTPQEYTFWLRWQVIPIALVVPAWLLFVLSRIGYSKRWFHPFVFILPIVTIVVTWYPASQPWMWYIKQFNQVLGSPLVQYATGSWFQFVHMPYTGGLFFLGLAVLVPVILDATPIQRWEFQVLLGTSFLVGAVNFVMLSTVWVKLRCLDLTPLAFTTALTLYCVVILQQMLLPASPMAYWQIFQGLETAILVLNRERQLLEYNPLAEVRFMLSSVSLRSHIKSLLVFMTKEHWAVLQREGTVECNHLDTHWVLRETPIFKETRFQKTLKLGYILCLDDVSEQRKLQSQLLEGALLYDPLTQLPNRTLFMKRVESALKKQIPLAVLFLDLDRFKSVNDSLGHRAGDYLLQQVAKHMHPCLKLQDMLARFGGDEFAILMEDVDEVFALDVCKRLQAAIHRPVSFEGYQLLVSASLGVAFAHMPAVVSRELSLSEKTTTTAEQLIRDADLAMYKAKATGKACHQVYNDALHQQAMATIQIETELRQALKQEQFELYYQPIIEINSETIVGVEALLRWHHPSRGLLSPPAFIPIAENLGIMAQVDAWVISEACRQYQQWQIHNPQQMLMVSANVSANNWGTQSLLDSVKQGLVGQNGDWLKLEISEGTLVNSAIDNAWVINQLKSLGVDIYLDDFGTGYSSLSYLCQICCDGLKIDQSFVTNLGQKTQAHVLVKTIVDLAHSLNLVVVAEGIETSQQREILKSLGCARGQGYLWSKPLPAKELEAKFMDT